MKLCTICKESKPLTEFNKSKAKKDGLQTHCRECSHKRFKIYYQKNRKKHRRIVEEQKAKQKIKLYEFLQGYFTEHPCVDCEETDQVLLEFDHVRGEKTMNISKAVANGWSIRRLQTEIDKCEVRCVKCHRLKTAERGNWYIWQLTRRAA